MNPPSPKKPRTKNETLRRHGFSIVARPTNGEPRWKRNGEIYTETEALRMCDKGE